MNKFAIHHLPLSNYAFALDEKTLVIRLRAAKNDLNYCHLYYGDTAYRGNPVMFTKIEMKIVLSDLNFDYYETIIYDCMPRVVYYFELFDGVIKEFYYGDMFYQAVTIERNELYKFPFNRKEDITYIPAWLKEAIVYNIFPDSFISKNHKKALDESTKSFRGVQTKKNHGGTLLDIYHSLDYLSDLGVDVIYLNPIFAGGEYHKYDVIDYFNIDPCFGSNDDFKRLVDAIHERDMKIIIDGVFNHCGWHFFAFDDVIHHQEASIYKDWFYHLEFPVKRPDNYQDVPNYACFGYERLMPKLNTSNKEVVKYFLDVCEYWVKNYKIDGWRLDVADEVNVDFWRAFKNKAQSIHPDVAIIGEVWQSAHYFLDGSMFHSVMNYDFLKYSKQFFAQKIIDANTFSAAVTQLLMRYRKPYNYGLFNLLDSHDVPRFLSHCNQHIPSYKLSFLFLMTFVGVPMMLYGDEQGLTGVTEAEYRQPMIYDGHQDINHFYKVLIKLRKEHKILSLGDFEMLFAQTHGGLLAYKRFDEKDEICIFINHNPYSKELPIDCKCKDILLSEGYISNKLAPYGFIILKT